MNQLNRPHPRNGNDSSVEIRQRSHPPPVWLWTANRQCTFHFRKTPAVKKWTHRFVGAYRENGLVFHETVTAYVDKHKMISSTKAYPHEMSAATLDEHIVYRQSLFQRTDGYLRTEKQEPTTYRLHLSSQSVLHTRIHAYASWWVTRIMQDIQNNILQVEKLRSETNR